jgi:hypothetical protein
MKSIFATFDFIGGCIAPERTAVTVGLGSDPGDGGHPPSRTALSGHDRPSG